MNLAAVPQTQDETEEQMSFAGFPIAESRFKLASKPLLHTAPLEPFQYVTGTFSGRVRAVAFGEVGERTWKRVYEVEVLEARLDG